MHLSEERFIEVLQDNQGIIRKVANSYCKNVEDRDDLIQEITIHLWKSWNRYNDQFKLSTWMYKIALNVAISFYRKTYRRNTLRETIQQESVFVDGGEDDDSSENVRMLYHYISQLDELNKALILLYLDKYSHEEIASTLGISKTNVATKISRIKQHLKKKFQEKTISQ
ncbi:sigma-70 family RNA polymerase sigma factor [Fulvivirgaceae bacterium BMA10]|uniref:Sigma-70 family RNA polymerase sigma factor n=1 Tax=Splendidivirga corallicola TaxID=3051826 RepID=A0ABT8KRL9_9BACT|nr:sigma-70 family RNA polymerase sigma factor [Fulvivirgaceae bacterium BMA10]